MSEDLLTWIFDAKTLLSAFWNAFWLFLGIVAGSLIQYRLAQRTVTAQRKIAWKVLDTEIAVNAEEVDKLLSRLIYLRERIAASQIEEDDIFISMFGFDYSAVNPLVNSGHFHSMLGADDVRHYFEFMRFFNNESAKIVNSTLRTEHERGKSLNYIDFLHDKAEGLAKGLLSIRPKIK